ncbi:MAG TPA: DUF222 domain-containing protein [Ilumatobacteraceae bacterium]|nr:DUF222 domain-containing protein [Ilumatobacteraceae bacterium]
MVEVGSVEELSALDGRALIDVLKELEVERRRLEGSIARVVAAAELTGCFAEDGHRSVRGWIMASTNCSLGEALGRARTARMLRQLPESRARLEAGEVGVDQVRVLARVHANPRCGDQLPESEASLVDHARRLRFDDFVTILRRWEALADTDGAHRAHELAHGRRTASVVEVGVGVVGEFRVGAMQGAAMREVFERFCEAEFHADWAEARARHGDEAHAGLLGRTDAQRRADAMFAIFEAAATAAPGSVAAEPVVNIVTDEATFEAHLRRAAGQRDVDMPRPVEYDTFRFETTRGIVLDPADIVIAATIGHVRRVVLNSAGVVTDMGRRRRLFTGAAREALDLQSGRCIWPGCGLPANRCQGDHTTEWSDLGHTKPENGAPACGRHNRLKSRGFRAHLDGDGIWHIYRPDGTEIDAA